MPKVTVNYRYIYDHGDWELFCKLTGADDLSFNMSIEAVISLEMAEKIGLVHREIKTTLESTPCNCSLYSYPSSISFYNHPNVTSTMYSKNIFVREVKYV